MKRGLSLFLLLSLLIIPSVFALNSADWIIHHNLNSVQPFIFEPASTLIMGVWDNQGNLVSRDPEYGERMAFAGINDFIWGTFYIYPDDPLIPVHSEDFQQGIPIQNTGWFQNLAASDIIDTTILPPPTQPEDYHVASYLCKLDWLNPFLPFYPFNCKWEILTFTLNTQLVPPTPIFPTPQPITQPRGSLGDEMFYYFEPQDETDFKIKEKDTFLINGIQESNIIKYEGIDFNNQVLTFTDLAKGLTQTMYTTSQKQGVMGESALIIGGVLHEILLDNNGMSAIDLNGDSKFDGKELQIITEFNHNLDLGGTNDLSGKQDFKMKFITPTQKIESMNNDEIFEFEIEQRGQQIGIKDISNIVPTPIQLMSNPELWQYQGVYGTFFEFWKPFTNTPEDLIIELPKKQKFATALLFEGNNYALIKDQANNLEINEYLGEIKPVYTEAELSGLTGHGVTTQRGISTYKQEIHLPKNTGQIIFGEDQFDNVGNFLFYKKGEEIYTYELFFDPSNPLRGDMINNKVPDFTGRELLIGGDKYEILDTSLNGNELKLTLTGGAIKDELNEGDIRTYSLGINQHQIEVTLIGGPNNDEVLFKVNGQTLPKMHVGDIEPTQTGDLLAVSEILTRQGQPSIVKFYFGASKMTLYDTDVTDNDFTKGGVNINNNQINNAEVKMKASIGRTLDFESLSYKLNAEGLVGDIYVPPGHTVKEYIDEPEGMIPNFNILYDGLNPRAYFVQNGVLTIQGMGGIPASTRSFVKLEALSRGHYRLKFTNNLGLTYAFHFVSNRNGNFKYGK